MKDTKILVSIQNAAGRLEKGNGQKYGWSQELHGLKKRVVRLLALLKSAMYPWVFGGEKCCFDNLGKKVKRYLRMSAAALIKILEKVSVEEPHSVVAAFLDSLGDIFDCLDTDIQAAYQGDPAARSEKEIMMAYPAFEAITVYRLAHRLHGLGVPLVPRMMTEYAHGKTGIDIHPGAKLGKSFFIDHGTGVVIGETCVIGNHVKIYQGVTLGAKSFELDEFGNPVKGIKRHPDIGSHVVIYAGATILGGDTVIGDNCVIGGNVWLTRSVPAGEKVFYNDGAAK